MSAITHAHVDLISYSLDRPVGGSSVKAVDLIIVQLKDADGAEGLGFSYVLGGRGSTSFAAARSQIAQFVERAAIVPPKVKWNEIYRSFNRTGLGPNLIALAAIDTALWDLHARRSGLPLGVAMGGKACPVSVYGSSGFSSGQSPSEAAETALRHVGSGRRGVKPRVSGARSDTKLLAAVRAAVGEAPVMADANEKCDLLSARWLLDQARDLGLLFVEEPIPSQNLLGYRTLANSGYAAIALGEHIQDLPQFASLIVGRTASVLQPDLAMIGGLTPILDLAVAAELFNVALSPHFLHGLFVHVAAASPAVAWLEEFTLIEPLFEGWPEISANGTVTMRDTLGHGLCLSDKAKALFR